MIDQYDEKLAITGGGLCDAMRCLSNRFLSVLAICLLFAMQLGCTSRTPPLAATERHQRICRVHQELENLTLYGDEVQEEFIEARRGKNVKGRYLVCGDDRRKPPVVLLHELPGLAARTLDYAASLAEGMDGFTVYVPLLLGEVYQDSGLAGTLQYAFDGDWDDRVELKGSSYKIQWLRKLIRHVAREHPGDNVGIIGNCLTGALPLALLDNPRVRSVVLAQPTLPLRTYFHLGGAKELAISAREWRCARWRVNPAFSATNPCNDQPQDGKPIERTPAYVYATRFEWDCIAPKEKHELLAAGLGTGFRDRQITDSEYLVTFAGKKPACTVSRGAHSTLIYEWMSADHGDNSTHPSEIRRREVRAFLRDPVGFRYGEHAAHDGQIGSVRYDKLPGCPKGLD